MKDEREFYVDVDKMLSSYRRRLLLEVSIAIVLTVVFAYLTEGSVLVWSLIVVSFLIFIGDLCQYPSSKKAGKKIRLQLESDRMTMHCEGSYSLLYKDIEVKDVKFRNGQVDCILLMDSVGTKVKLRNFRGMDKLLLILKDVEVRGADAYS